MVAPTAQAATPSPSQGRTAPAPETEPIAIIGIGCRFPGGANDPHSFWRLLCDKVDAITALPAERFDRAASYDPRPTAPGKIATRHGGFLDQAHEFDAAFFGISPREAARMDPQQQLLLEVAWEALEDAGQVQTKLSGSPGGVFIGMIYNDYEDLQLRRPADMDIYTAVGGFRSSAASRLSHAFDLQGPSLVIDTAASSSLVSVHLACQSLRSRECTLALAGGVNLMLHLDHSLGFTWANMLAPDGRCKFGDARADGFVRSEGVGLVVLKPLSLALAESDPIYAVIRGSAVNHDGRTSPLMQPSRQGQQAVLRQAYHNAGVCPGQVRYVECHGTGTPIGDLVEIQALGTVLAEGRPKDRPCIIGSVKTNIGHTEGAAGIAGLIKAALCLKHRAIPASLHVREPCPAIPWQKLPLLIQQELGPWPVDSEPALAGVSAFGLTGTNAHVVLEEAPRRPVREETPLPSEFLLTLSAHRPAALQALGRAYQAFLADKGSQPEPRLQDICYTASVRRNHHDHRLALTARSREELVEKLACFLQGEPGPGWSSGRSTVRPPIAFVFPGQGSQWVGMGRELAQEPAFRDSLEQWDRAIQRYAGWSMLKELASDAAQARLDEIDVIQPILVAVEVALAALWRSWGITPAAVVGHSLGEVAAAHVAGALSLDDAARIICRRSQFLRRTSGQGAMAVTGLTLPQAQAIVASYEKRVSIAVSNSPTSTVLAGDPATLDDILNQLQRQNVFCRRVKVDVASHSPQMDAWVAPLVESLAGLQPQAAAMPIYSTVTGERKDDLFDAAYWGQNLRQTVLFSAAIQHMLKDGYNTFLEISPHPILLSAIQQGMQHEGQAGVALPSLRRGEGERAVMMQSLGALYTLGCSPEWTRLYPAGGQCIGLPAYPWPRERESRGGETSRSGEQEQPKPGRAGSGLTRDMLLAAPPEERRRLLESYICEQVARTLETARPQLDVRQALTRLGLDSLMIAELARRMEANLGIALPVATLLDNCSIAQLAAQALDLLATATAPSTTLATPKDAERLLAQLDQLSDSQVDALIGDLLAKRPMTSESLPEEGRE